MQEKYTALARGRVRVWDCIWKKALWNTTPLLEWIQEG